MPPQSVTYLLEHGPSVMADLPDTRLTKWARQSGARSFSLSASSASTLYGSPTTVYYHVDHDRVDVLRRFLEANHDIVDDQSFRDFQRLLAQQTSGWKPAGRELREEFFDDEEYEGFSTEDYENDRECPTCGADVPFNALPEHLRNSCEG